jgi:hypothetical protein
MESPRPRVTAMSLPRRLLRQFRQARRLPASAGLSLAKPTSISLSPEMARMHTVIGALEDVACRLS